MSDFGIHETCPCGSSFQMHSDGVGTETLMVQLQAWREGHAAHLGAMTKVMESDGSGARQSSGDSVRTIMLPVAGDPTDAHRAAEVAVQFMQATYTFVEHFRTSPLTFDERFKAFVSAWDEMTGGGEQ